jgi:hypothetical protein
MKNIYLLRFIVALVFLQGGVLYAQYDATPRDHFIILVDGGTRPFIERQKPVILDFLNDLSDVTSKEGGILSNEILLNNNDVVSFLSFSASNDTLDIQKFYHFDESYIKEEGYTSKPYKFGFIAEPYKASTFEDIEYNISKSEYFLFRSRWSLQVTARNFILPYIEDRDTTTVNRVFLCVISNTKESFGKHNSSETEIEELQRYNKDFKVPNSVGELNQSIGNDFIMLGNKLPYKQTAGIMNMSVYKVIPKVNFDLKSIYTIPENLELKKRLDGYAVSHNFKKGENANNGYTIRKAKIVVKDKEGKVLQTEEISNFSGEDFNIDFFIPYDKLTGKEVKADIQFWVQKNSPVFSKFILSPYDSDTTVQNRLTARFSLDFQKKAKILGIFPMPNGMYRIAAALTSWLCGENEYYCVWFWNILLVILMVLAFWYIAIVRLKRNIDRGDNAYLEREPSEEAIDTRIDFNDQVTNFKAIKNNKQIIVTDRKKWLIWDYKVDYEHYLISTNLLKTPNNLILDKENLVRFKKDYTNDEQSINKIERLPITSKTRKFDIGINSSAVLDFYDFNLKRSTDKVEKLSFELLSYSKESNYKVKRVNIAPKYNLDLQFDREKATPSMTYFSDKPNGIIFSNDKNSVVIGCLIIENKTQKVFGHSFSIKNLAIDDDRFKLDTKAIQVPVIYTIDKKLVADFESRYTDYHGLGDLIGTNYIYKEELLEVLDFITDESIKDELCEKAITTNPLYKFDRNEQRLSLEIPAKTSISIPVCVDLSQFSNPEQQEREVSFAIGYSIDGRERVNERYAFLLIKDKLHADLIATLKKSNGGSHSLVNDSVEKLGKLGEWNILANGQISLFTISFSNEADVHRENQNVEIRNLAFKFKYDHGRSNLILKGTDNDAFMVYRNDIQSTHDYPNLSYLNNTELDEFSIILNKEQILEIRKLNVDVTCEVSYYHNNVLHSHQVIFSIEKRLSDNWLALDLGTSAIVAAFTDDVYSEDNDAMLLDLQESLHTIIQGKSGTGMYKYDKHNIEELDYEESEVQQILEDKNAKKKVVLGHLMSSSIILNNEGELDADVYHRNIANLSPTIAQMQEDTHFVIPYLKSLIGTDRLNGYGKFNYFSETFYKYDERTLKKLQEENQKDLTFMYYLKIIREEIGTSQYTQREFLSKLKRIFGREDVFDMYKDKFVGKFEYQWTKILQKAKDYKTLGEINDSLYNSICAKQSGLIGVSFTFYSDYIYALKKLFDDKISEDKIIKDLTDEHTENRVVTFTKRYFLQHQQSKGLGRDDRLEVTTILQNAYISVLRDFIYPQVYQRIKQKNTALRLSDAMNKIVLSYPNTFSPLHVEHIKEEVIYKHFFEFHKDYVKFISESDAIAFYYTNKMYDKKRGETEYVLVYDMGAGTLDLTYFRIEKKGGKVYLDIVGKAGKTTAGNYLDRILTEWVFNEYKDKFVRDGLFDNERDAEQRRQSIVLKNFVKRVVKPNIYGKTKERIKQDRVVFEELKEVKELLVLRDFVNDAKTKQTQYEQLKKSKREVEQRKLQYEHKEKDYQKLSYQASILQQKIEHIEQENREITSKKNLLDKVFTLLELEKSSNKSVKLLNDWYANILGCNTNRKKYEEYLKIEVEKKAFATLGDTYEDFQAVVDDLRDNSLSIISHLLHQFKVKDYSELMRKAKITFDNYNKKRKELEGIAGSGDLYFYFSEEKDKFEKVRRHLQEVLLMLGMGSVKDKTFAIIAKKVKDILSNKISELNKSYEKPDTSDYEKDIEALQSLQNELSILNKEGIDDTSIKAAAIHEQEINNDFGRIESELKSMFGVKDLEGVGNMLLQEELRSNNITGAYFEHKEGDETALDLIFQDLTVKAEQIEAGENVLFVENDGEWRGIINERLKIDLNELKKAEVIADYINANTVELLNEFFEIYKNKIKDYELNVAFPISKVLLTGRGAQFNGLKAKLEETMVSRMYGLRKNGHSKIDDSLIKEGNLKTIVASGSLYYANHLESKKKSQIILNSDNLNSIYGVFFKKQGKWHFESLLEPGAEPLVHEPNRKDGFCIYDYFHSISFDFEDVTEFKLIQSYVSDPLKYKEQDRQEYYTVVKSFSRADYDGAEGIGIELSIKKGLEFYIYRAFSYTIDNSFLVKVRRESSIPKHIAQQLQNQNVLFQTKEAVQEFFKKYLNETDYNKYSRLLLYLAQNEIGLEKTELQLSKLNDLIQDKTYQYSLWPYLS